MTGSFDIAAGTGSLVVIGVLLSASCAAAESQPPVRAPIPVARVFDRTIYAKDLEPSAEDTVAAMLAMSQQLGVEVPDDERTQLVEWHTARIAKMSKSEKKRHGKAALSGLIWRPLKARYIDEHELQPTVRELEDSRAAFRKSAGKFEEVVFQEVKDVEQQASPEQIKVIKQSLKETQLRMSDARAQQWKFDKALYAEFGGRVIFQQANPREPIGAYRRWFAEHERTGNLEIYDADMRQSFWKYYKDNDRDHNFGIAEPEPFRTPWWREPVEE